MTDFSYEPSTDFDTYSDPPHDPAHRYDDPDVMYADRNNDGWTDTMIEDFDRDGDIDQITYYPREPGLPTTVHVATGAFGETDPSLGYAVDTNGDGDMDRVVLDSTNHTHTVYEDTDYDGVGDVTYTIDDRYSGNTTVEPGNARHDLP